MITVNSLSGGKTSSQLAMEYPADYEVFSLVCIDDRECAPQDKAVIDYANKKLEKFHPEYGEFVATAEDDLTLTAMMDLEQLLGREIIWVRGKSFDTVIDERWEMVKLGNRKRLPSWARRYCTEEMKLLPIFMWWFYNIGEKVNMRIGFRFDEFYRLEKFFNNSDPSNFSIPVACSTRGKRLQRHESFNWRFVSMPLVKAGIKTENVASFWADKYVKGNLFQTEKKIEFPVISNCIGCFHKKVETLAVMSNNHPAKMRWFARQEKKGMGTWLDSRITYEEIIENATGYSFDSISASSCDSGGCTD